MKTAEYLEQIDKVIEAGIYKDTWESLCEYDIPKWYQKAKFGIFIHWGVYSVPAFRGEWYARQVYRQYSPEYNHHVAQYGPLNEFGYKDFIPMFKAEHFNADEWVALFKDAGAKYIMPVAEHHDGFQMYESDLSPWNAKEMGPKRDILGELKESIEANGLTFCASSHRAENWWFFNCGRDYDSDVNDPANAGLYGAAAGYTSDHHSFFENTPSQSFLEDWLVRSCEIVDKYQPKIVFFDTWIQQVAFKPYLKKFAAYYYNRGVEWGIPVAINAKKDAYVHGSVVKDIERGQLSNIACDFWQNDTSVTPMFWAYTEGNTYKAPRSIVCDLIDVVSKNGALLLNVGPKSDGTFGENEKHILKEIGKWMKVNGEAIYDTIPWKVYGEGPTEVPEGHFTDGNREEFGEGDVRYTAKANCIYAFIMKMPADGKVNLHALAQKYHRVETPIRRISVLGYGINPRYEFRGEPLEVQTTISDPGMPVVLKIEIM